MSTAISNAAAEQLRGSQEGSREHLRALFSEGLLRHDAILLDSVFGAFAESNSFRGTHYELKDIVASTSGKRHFRFEHLSIPYLATIDIWQAPDREYIVIRLPNDGYSYARAAGQTFYRHRCDGWSELDGTLAMEFFPSLCQKALASFTRVVFYYNEQHNRVDIMLLPDGDGAGLMVAFEPGYPYKDPVPVPLPRLR
jgi:hypothetical protein